MDTPSAASAFPRQFARTRRFSLGSPGRFTVSPDGERVLFVRSASGTDPRPLLWSYEGGEERLLAEGVGSYAADRAVRLAAFLRGDGELWTIRTDAGAEPHRVPTAGPAVDPQLSPDGTRLAYVTGGALHVVSHPEASEPEDRILAAPEAPDVSYGLAEYVTGRAHGYWWSPEGEALLVARLDESMVQLRYIADPTEPTRPPRAIRYPAAGTANAEISLSLFDLTGRQIPTPLTDFDFEYLIAADWSDPRGPLLVLHSRDQRTLWTVRVDPATGRVEELSRHTDPAWVDYPPGLPLHTASGADVQPELRRTDDTYDGTYALRIGEGEDALTPAGLQVREVLGAVGERVYFTASEEPTETHVWSWRPGDGAGPERLTSEPGVHTAAVGGDTVVLDSRTPDGQAVTVLRGGEPAGTIAVLTEEPLVSPRPALLRLGKRELCSRLHLPSWYEPGAAAPALPVLLSPYSGPAKQVVTQAREWYTAVCQWFAEQGFAVLAVDGPGTPGRGPAWERKILGDRLHCVLDAQVEALHAAADRYPGTLDLSRVGIRGWSYSGYLAVGALLHRPEVFHAATAGAAPADRSLYHTYWEERFLGDPARNPDAYHRSSLLPHAARLTRPLLLIHGLADTNVHPAHTFRLSSALLAAGRPHSLLPLPDQGHRPTGEGVADRVLEAELAFLRESLK